MKIFLASFLVFFGSWFIVNQLGVNKLAIQSEDTVPALFLPLAIIQNNTLYLDQYYLMMIARYPQPDDRSSTPFYLRKVGSHTLSAFPIITPLLMVPIYFLAKQFRVTFDWNTLEVLAHIGGALIMASAVLAFYTLLKNRFKLNQKPTTLLTLVYAFGTINFALVSQGLWQHGSVQLFIILGINYLLKYLQFDKNIYLVYLGLFFGTGVLARPTAGLVVAAILVYLLIKKRSIKILIYIVLGMLAPVVFFIWYNAKFYAGIQNQGYFGQVLGNWLGGFPLSFLGVWLSPSKGILIYSPILIFSFLGINSAFKNNIRDKYLYMTFFIITILHTLVISFWKHWYGGWSFGYRMSSDVIPFLVLLIVPWLTSDVSKRAFKIFIMLLTFSVVVQLFGIVFFDGVWHAVYDKGYEDTGWLWSIRDSEIMFNVRRALVKVGFMTKACDVCLPGVE